MTRRRFIFIVLVALLALGGQMILNPTTVLRAETAAMPARELWLRPPKAHRDKALVVVLAQNSGTETTDFLVPLGILRASGTADVISVSSDPGDVRLMPALTIRADMTLSDFDAAHPEGADMVIVPAMHDRKNPRTLAWLKAQHQSHAVIVSICEGAWLLAHAGLLEGRQATTHWYALPRISRKFPGTTWIVDSRYVVDGDIMTTTGISASVPATLALVQALSNRRTTLATARKFGFDSWDAAHDSGSFAMPLGLKLTAAGNLLGFAGHETISIPIADGTDEVTLALVADAWSRTYRSKAKAVNAAGQVVSNHGVVFVTETVSGDLTLILPSHAAQALDHALTQIERRYGPDTREFVRVQLEYRVR